MIEEINCIYCHKKQEYEIDMKGSERNKIVRCNYCQKKFMIRVYLLMNKYMVSQDSKDLNKISTK